MFRSFRVLGPLALALALALSLASAPDALAAAKSAKAATGKAKAKTETTKAKAKAETTKAKKKTAKAKKAPVSQASLEQRLAEIERKAEAKARLQRELDESISRMELAQEMDVLERIDSGESLDLEMVGDTYWHSLGVMAEKNPLEDAQALPETPIVGPLADGVARYGEPPKPLGARYAFRLEPAMPDASRFLPSITPIRGNGYYISSDFGPRKNPKRRKRVEFHGGIDIAGAFKTPIVAAADGIVETSRLQRGYGNVVWVRHREGLVTGYAHMTKRVAKPGQYVSRGDLLGYMGRTGRATGVHLHYMVIHDGRFVDPFPFLGKDLTARLDVGKSNISPMRAFSAQPLIKNTFLGEKSPVAFPEFSPGEAGAPYQTSVVSPAPSEEPSARTVTGPLASLAGQAYGDETVVTF